MPERRMTLKEAHLLGKIFWTSQQNPQSTKTNTQKSKPNTKTEGLYKNFTKVKEKNIYDIVW